MARAPQPCRRARSDHLLDPGRPVSSAGRAPARRPGCPAAPRRDRSARVATPTGRFAVTDKLDGTAFSSTYGCCVIALSGHQRKLPPGWQGGDRLALHGTDAPSTVGFEASAGCSREADAAVRAVMRRVPLGAPVRIKR